MKKNNWLVLFIAFCVGFAYVEANASIIVDPGPDGSAQFYRLEFDELIGLPLDGRTIDLAFDFLNGASIDWLPGSGQRSRTVGIDYYADPIGNSITGMSASGGVTDMFGNLIGEQPPTRASSFFYGADAGGFGGAWASFEPGSTPLTFYGAIMTITLPSVPGAYINWSAVTFSQSGEGLYVISTVPAPPAFWLFGTGLLGLAGISRHKKSPLLRQ